MRRIYFFGAMSIFMLGASSVSASDILCEGCDTTAMKAAALDAGVGNHRVYSMTTGIIEGFNIACPDGKFEDRATRTDRTSSTVAEGQSVFPACRKPLVARSLSLNVESRKAILAIHDLSLAIEKAGGPSVDFAGQEMPGAFADSVLDVLSDHQERQSMFDWMAKKSALFERYHAAVDAAARADLKILSAQLPVTITFNDGSKVRAVYTASTKVLSLLAESSRASTGVAIVEANKSNYRGNYPIAGMDMSRYLAHLTSIGVAVSGTGQASMKCTWSPSRLSCQRSDRTL